MPRILHVTLVAAALAAAGAVQAADAVHAEAAQALLKRNQCGKCHSVDKKKDGPSFMETAAKLKGKPDAEETLFKHLTTSPTVKIDGKEEKHKAIKADDDAQVRNLVRWILTR